MTTPPEDEDPPDRETQPGPHRAEGARGREREFRGRLWVPELVPLPQLFHSEETGEPFRACVDCGIPLYGRDDAPDYMVQKASNGRETVFEFALCIPCAEKLHDAYSDESLSAIRGFFAERVDIETRMRKLRKMSDEPRLDRWLEDCLTCGRPPAEDKGFATVGLCSGHNLVFTHAPFRVCEKCELALNEQISAETRGEWDRFVERNFDLPPSEVLSPDSPPIVMV